MNMLFVEDSEIILLNYKIMFVPHKNITIYSATTLRQAKVILSKEKINIMTLDVFLPDGNGINFLKWVKREFCDVYVIMMSCFLDEMVEQEAKKIGAYSCLD